MTEPVAYLAKSRKSGAVNATVNEWNYHDFENIPLYTKEQLHPRVKMTQAEFDEFKKILSIGISTIYEAFDVIDSDRGEMDEFEQLYNRLFTNGVNEETKRQNEFAKLWDSLLGRNVKELVEIVPTKKWFVRSKKAVGENNFYAWLFNNDFLDVPAHMISDEIPPLAMKFDTKEQAEQWTNPLTEAVQLPVEDE